MWSILYMTPVKWPENIVNQNFKDQFIRKNKLLILK